MIIAQISDPHISLADGEADPFATAAHLEAAVVHTLELPQAPDLVFVSGDCVDRGTPDEYQLFRDLIRPLRMPVYVIPGNHDDRSVMRDAFGDQGRSAMAGFIQYVVEDGPVRSIALDTHVPGRADGQLCAERLGWLETRLTEDVSRPTMIFMHHPPFRTGIPVLDDLGLEELEVLGAIIARHPNVVCLAAGHFHRSIYGRVHGVSSVVCPSTAHQIALDLEGTKSLVAVMEPPACLLHVWDERTGLVTHSSPIGRFERIGDS